jgi:uncharacterized protein (TIGR03000 family)
MSPLLAEAQRGGHGGGHGGGGHGGGFHSSAAFHGGGHGGGFHGNSFHGGNFAHDGHHGGFDHHHGFFPGVALGFGLYNPFWYGGYGYDYGSPYSYYDYYGSPTYYNSYYSAPTYAAPSYDYVNPVTPAAPVNNTAEMDILLPTADAQVWVDGNQMSMTGTYRSFVSPPLQPGYSYTYHVAAAWMDNGREVRAERTVPVTAGQVSRLDFSSGGHALQMPAAQE